jgi:hypothetical protein
MALLPLMPSRFGARSPWIERPKAKYFIGVAASRMATAPMRAIWRSMIENAL